MPNERSPGFMFNVYLNERDVLPTHFHFSHQFVIVPIDFPSFDFYFSSRLSLENLINLMRSDTEVEERKALKLAEIEFCRTSHATKKFVPIHLTHRPADFLAL